MNLRPEQFTRTEFPVWRNLADKQPATFGVQPWDWDVTKDAIHQMQSLPKPARRKLMKEDTTIWNCYSCVLGTNWYSPTGTTNPPTMLLGFAVDYDCPMNFGYIAEAMKERQRLGYIIPNYLETSLSGKARAVWTFERPVPVDGVKFCNEFLKRLATVLDAEHFLIGVDRKSFSYEMRWTNGGFWQEMANVPPLKEDLLLGIAVKVATALSEQKANVPLERAQEELAKRYPRFKEFNGGRLIFGSVGIRFWDDTADNSNAARVIDKGFYCLTGPKPVVTWDELLGPGLAEELRATNFGEAAKGMFFDGKHYFMETNLGFHEMERVDMMLAIATHGFDRSRAKEEATSPAEQVLSFVQHHKRVDGAAPLLYLPNGVIPMTGKLLLNTSRIKPMTMAEKINTTCSDFPWLDAFMDKIFVQREGQLHPRHYFQTWLRRFYRGAITGRPVNGQALFFCGPNGCGKNFISELLIPSAMGGTASNPYKLLMGETGFSDDVLEVPVLAINDEDAPPEFKKNQWEQKIKSLVANNVHSFHAKFAKNVRIVWYGRLIVTLNDGPKDIGILPMLHAYTKDKLCYFLLQKHDQPFYDIYENQELVKRELPYFLRWLIDVYQPPEGLETNDRFGMKSYHDPYLVRVNRQEQLSYNLLELIAAWMKPPNWNNNVDTWVGTPTDLIRDMGSVDSFDALLKSWEPNKVSKALGDLARTGVPGIEADAQFHGRRYILTRSKVMLTVTDAPQTTTTEQTEMI